MNEYSPLKNVNRGYMKLEVWHRSLDLFERVFSVTHQQKHLDFKLRSQLVDAAQSVSANIAEGYGRRSLAEYIQYLYIAKGSLGETLTRLIGLLRTLQLTPEAFGEIDKIHYEVENKLLALIKSLENKKQDGSWSDRLAEESPDYRIAQDDSSSPNPPIR